MGKKRGIFFIAFSFFLLVIPTITSAGAEVTLPSNFAFDACNDINWATWTNFNGSSALGTINNGGDIVNVNMTSNFTFSSTPQIYNHAKFATYPAIIPNTTVPQTTWSAGQGGTTTMCFSKTVSNPVLLLASLGSSSGIQSKLTFTKPYVVLFDGGGMVFHDSYSLTGTEGYAIIMFPGDFDCVTVNSTTPEFYTNITWGTRSPPFPVNISENKTCGETTLTASGGITYQWNGGDTPNSATNTFHTNGTYIVTATAANGCKTYVSRVVEINRAQAQITGSTVGCTDVTLTASGGVSYVWNGGSSPNTATNTFTTSGTYTVTATDLNGCTASANVTVTLTHPTVVISGTKTNCDQVTLTASGGASYLWDGGQNPTSATNIFTTSGKYTVVVTDATGCKATAQVDVVVNKAIATITGNLTGCETVTLTASGGNSYFWDGGLNPTSATNSFTTSGKYTVIVTDINGCKATAQADVVVINPKISLAYDANTCGAITVTASGASTYLWNGGANPTSASNTFSISGKYTVVGTTAMGCTVIATVDLQIKEPVTPRITISSSTMGPICPGTPVTFTSTITNGGTSPSYRWLRNGIAVSSNETYISLDLGKNDIVNCELLGNASCATTSTVISNSITVDVLDAPILSFPTKTITSNTPIQLDPNITGTIVAYEWSPSEGLSNVNIKNPIANPKTSTTYQLKVRSTTGCESYSSVTVTILRALDIPNTFSPNGDGINDTWVIGNLAAYPGSSISIYSRFGTVLYRSSAIGVPWNGKYHGKTLPAGTYYYVITLKNQDLYYYKGSITLLN